MTMVIACKLLTGSMLLGWEVDTRLKRELELVHQPRMVIPIVSINILILSTASFNIQLFKLMLLVGVMIYASYYDLETNKVERSVHLLIIAIGSLGMTSNQLLTIALPGLIISPLLLVMINLITSIGFKRKVIGMGDIFYVAALGYTFGVLIITLGLLVGILIIQVTLMIKKHDKGNHIPFIPYITIGNLMVVLLLLKITQ